MKLTLVVAGIGVALAAPLVKKAIRPAGVYVLAGAMIAYETACGFMESSDDLFRRSLKRIHHKVSHELSPENGKNLTTKVS